MIIYTDGVFDLFHYGHINLLKKAKEFGTKLYVGIHNDNDVKSYKRLPIIKYGYRKCILDSCKYIDKVIPDAPLTIDENFLNKHKIDLVIHAHNKDEDEKYYFMYKNCIKLGKFKRIDYTQGISTTDIIQRIFES